MRHNQCTTSLVVSTVRCGASSEALAFCGNKNMAAPQKTIVYIDGFNLYYGQLKGTPHKWLDPVRLFQQVLGHQNNIVEIKYFTARVKPTPTDPDVHIRQDAYFRAIQANCPLVTLHFGHFLRHRVRMENASSPPATWEVWKTDEKGSDVNLSRCAPCMSSSPPSRSSSSVPSPLPRLTQAKAPLTCEIDTVNE